MRRTILMTQAYINTTPNSYKMVTFNVPNHLVNNFDELRKFKRLSRTSTLINLMESFVREEILKLEKDNTINKFILDMKRRNQNPSQPSFNKQKSQSYSRWEDSYDDTPTPLIFDDDEINDDWRRDLVRSR